MIVSINKVKHFGLFKDFKWSGDIPGFRQYNLIYGWNYSGKTTLSRIFRCIELKELHSDFQNAEFDIVSSIGKIFPSHLFQYGFCLVNFLWTLLLHFSFSSQDAR